MVECGNSMSQMDKWSRYTLDVFLEEANKSVKDGNRVYCNILIAYPRVFNVLPKKFKSYGLRKNRPWTVEMRKCGEEDLFGIIFEHKETCQTVPFLWKIIIRLVFAGTYEEECFDRRWI